MLQSFQSQTPNFVAPSDDLVRTFSKMNGYKFFLQFTVLRDAEGNFL